MSPVLRPVSAGVVYTPPEVAGPMVRRALEPLLSRSATQLLALRVCDPAIGEGAFLVEALAILGEALVAAWRREGTPGTIDDARHAAAGCLVGCDIDARAVATARATLGEAARIVVGDALALDWRALVPDGFDAVVGNPPYIRQERLGAHKPALLDYASYNGVADLYVYFIELAHRISRPGGRFCLITPNKWLTAAYARALREFLSRAGSVEGVIDLGRSPLFADADAFPCIVWGTVGNTRGETSIFATRAIGDVANALESGTPHARARWQSAPWHIDDPRDRERLERLERFPKLGDLVGRPARGVVTGCNRAFVIDRFTRDRLLAREPHAQDLIRPFAKGRDVRSWHVATPASDRFILLVDRGTPIEQYPAVVAHLAQYREALEPRARGATGPGRKPGAYRWYELQDPVGVLAASRAPRLLYQDIQTQPACALDRSGDIVPDTTVWILPTADRYLLAVLNSSLYGWYAQRRFPPALNGAVRPKLEYMRDLPIAPPSPAARRTIEDLVDQQLANPTPELSAAIDAAVLECYGEGQTQV